MKSSFALLLCAAAFVFCVGCAAVGNKQIADEKTIGKVAVGKSTKADVQSLFGQPTTTLPMENNEEVWIYNYSKSQARATSFIPYVGAVVGGSDIKTSSLTFRFSADGIVKYVGRGSQTGGGGGLQDVGR